MSRETNKVSLTFSLAPVIFISTALASSKSSLGNDDNSANLIPEIQFQMAYDQMTGIYPQSPIKSAQWTPECLHGQINIKRVSTIMLISSFSSDQMMIAQNLSILSALKMVTLNMRNKKCMRIYLDFSTNIADQFPTVHVCKCPNHPFTVMYGNMQFLSLAEKNTLFTFNNE